VVRVSYSSVSRTHSPVPFKEQENGAIPSEVSSLGSNSYGKKMRKKKPRDKPSETEMQRME
jgi:hypothetical protein